MPLVYQQNINEHTKIGVWHILETEDFFLEKAKEQYKISHFKKKLQHLAGRYLLLEMEANISLKNIISLNIDSLFLITSILSYILKKFKKISTFEI